MSPGRSRRRLWSGEGAELRERFGEVIRRERQRRGLTQEELAERSNLSVDAIRRLERGRFSPTLETLRKLASGLDVSLHALFDELDPDHAAQVREVGALLRRRSPGELRLAWRVVRAMFDEGG